MATAEEASSHPLARAIAEEAALPNLPVFEPSDRLTSLGVSRRLGSDSSSVKDRLPPITISTFS